MTGECTQKATAAAGVVYPRLDADLFDRYFAGYLERGFLPPPPSDVRSRRPAKQAVACYENPRFLERVLRRYIWNPRCAWSSLPSLRLAATGASGSSELTSWRRQWPSGLFKCRLTFRKSPALERCEVIELVIKAKPSDRDALDVGETVGSDVQPHARGYVPRVSKQDGLTACHLREMVIYEQSDEGLRRHVPRCFGTWRDDDRGEWGMALEHLEQVVLMDEVNPEAWSPAHIDAAMAGLSQIHAVWYGREEELAGATLAGGLGEPLTLDRALELTPLWRALAAHASPYFTSWAGPSVSRTHTRLVESIADWPPLNDSPRTLVHNNFKPAQYGAAPGSRRPPFVRVPTGNWRRSARRNATWQSSSPLSLRQTSPPKSPTPWISSACSSRRPLAGLLLQDPGDSGSAPPSPIC